jgi:hypothetical protein
MSRRRRPKRPGAGTPANAAPGFWGDNGDSEAGGESGTRGVSEGPVRLPADPTALLRSLGEPPLGPNTVAAQHQLAIVYDEAVRAAIALAAANGLLEMPEDPGGG